MKSPRLTTSGRRRRAKDLAWICVRGERGQWASTALVSTTSLPSPAERRRALAPVRRLRRLLREVQAGAEVWQQHPDDTTRGWCCDLSTYLRGNVAALVLVAPPSWDALERSTGRISPRNRPSPHLLQHNTPC